jgi:Na+/proline symporter
MLEKAPAAHKDWGGFARPEFIALWFVGLMITKLFEENSIDKSAKYLMTRSDRHARMTLIIPMFGTLLAPLLWLVPPTVAAIRHGGEIGQVFQKLKFPEEGAFLLTASEVLPTGMLGLLVCGIFAATLTTMDAGLNQGAGIFVRNFYLPILNPRCDEKKLLWISKISTGVFGLVMIGSAMAWETMRNMQLFDLVNQVAISLGLPMAIPLFFGLFWRRTPRWAAWSTVLVGLAASFTVKFFLKPEMFGWVPGLEGPYKPEEITTFYIFASVFIVGLVCAAWFFGSSLFYNPNDKAYMADLDDFFGRLKTPVKCKLGDEGGDDRAVAGSIGKLLLIYGLFVASLVWVPNEWSGRLCFVGIGGGMALCGFLLWQANRRRKPAVTE